MKKIFSVLFVSLYCPS